LNSSDRTKGRLSRENALGLDWELDIDERGI
jgi:hypothetical protein